jgi:8-oxo-dGTP diphosphatase
VQYYVETDGKVFLVHRGETLDLPTPEDVSFDVERIARLPTSTEVWFCVPLLEEHPSDWFDKDELPTQANVTSLVRAAVHATMPRVVVEGVCLQDERVLLVKGSRGLTKGLWTLPGGFLRFGENPRCGLLREIREEIRVEAAIETLLSVRSRIGRHSCLHWILFFYRIHLGDSPRPNPDEITEACFVPIPQAAEMLRDEVMADVVRSLAAS